MKPASSECDNALQQENDSLRQMIQKMEKIIEELDDIISAKDRKIVYFNDHLFLYTQHYDPTVEHMIFSVLSRKIHG
jgi:hypothetical protein